MDGFSDLTNELSWFIMKKIYKEVRTLKSEKQLTEMQIKEKQEELDKERKLLDTQKKAFYEKRSAYIKSNATINIGVENEVRSALARYIIRTVDNDNKILSDAEIALLFEITKIYFENTCLKCFSD